MERGEDGIRHFVVGALQTNCYAVVSKGECLVIDPGALGDRIGQALIDEGVEIVGIVATHGHHDHVCGVTALKRLCGADFMVSTADAWRCTQALELSSHAFDGMLGGLEDAPVPDRELKDGDVVRVGDIELRVIETPGHTEGSIVLLGDGVAFTGDTVFAGSVGRCDLLGGDMEAEMRSIARLKTMIDPDCALLCGHGPATTMGQELRYNPYFA